MYKLFRLFKTDEEENVAYKMLNIIFLYITVFCVLGYLVFSMNNFSYYLKMAIALAIIIIVGLWGISVVVKSYNTFAVILSYIMNIIVLPLFFVFGGGIYSGAPLLFVGGYIITFILLNGIQLIAAVAVESIWYIFVFSFAYYYPERINIVSQGHPLFIDIVTCFIATVIITILVMRIYDSIFRKLKNSIEQSKKTVENTGAVKSRFLANMSHELRTPMNAILGMAELLERDERAAKVAFEIGMIKESAFSLLSTINNVLMYSKLDSKKLELIPQQFHFGKLLRDVIYTINMEIEKKNIQFVTDIDPAIPDVFYADESRIREIFHYILFNAVKDTDDGRIMMEVKFKKNPKRNNITIFARVSDTGTGLAEDEKNAIFNSFEIYDSKRYSQLKRIGLELTICRDLLALMNGNIRIDSINGVGSTVYFQFDVFNAERTPIVPDREIKNEKALVYVERDSRTAVWNDLLNQFGIVPDIVSTYAAFDVRLKEKRYNYIFVPEVSFPNLENLITSYSLEEITYVTTDYRHVYGDFGKCRILRKPISCLNVSEVMLGTWNPANYRDIESKDTFEVNGANVLVVDDNMVNLKVAVGLLQKYGINAAIASSGKEAIDKCERELFDLILLDQMMPQMDGIETLAKLRESVEPHYHKVPVICMTATIGTEIREDMLRAGFQEYLAKPIKIRYLENVLKTFIPQEKIIYRTKNDKSEKNKSDSSVQDFAPGLSVDAGLARMGGDENIYADILNTYLKEGAQKIEDILSEHESGDLPLFVINVHAVKGSSASIGGLEVSELFRQLEMAGKGNDTRFIEEHLDNAIEKYRTLLDDIHAYLETKGKLEIDENQAEDIEEEDFPMETMRAMAEYLENFETEFCEGVVEQWSGHNYGDEINNYIQGIKRACESYDYDRAAEFVNEFLEVFEE